MAAPTTAELVSILGRSGQTPVQRSQELLRILGNDPSLDRQNAIDLANSSLKSQSMAASQPDRLIEPWNTTPEQNAARDAEATGTFVTPAGTVTPQATTTTYTTPGTGELNVPYGADFLDPAIRGLLGILGLEQQGTQFGQSQAQQQQQFQSSLLLQAAQALAGLRTNPNSAAEAAIMASNLGQPTGLPSSLGIEQLIRDATLGAGTQKTGNVAGTDVSLPGSLGGSQLAGILGTDTEGVLSSFAKAIGDPNYLANSIRALIPSGFGGAGSGLG